MHSRIYGWTCWIALFLCIGCGTNDGTYPVTGTLTLADGETFSSGNVQFTSEDGKRFSSTAKPDGTFQLSKTATATGLEPGTYKVVVQETNFDDIDQAPVPVIDRKYISEDTTDLEVTVKEEANHFDLKLDRYAPRKRN